MSNSLFESMLYSQLGGGGLGGLFGGQIWLYVAYLVCLFAVIIYKPERIRNLSMYRRACYLFAISLLLPSLINLAMGTLMAGSGGGPFISRGSSPAWAQPGVPMPGGSQLDSTFIMQVTLQILNTFGPVLFGISVLCALISLVPSFIPPPDFEMIGSEPNEPPRLRQPRGLSTSGNAGAPNADVPIS